MSETEIRDFIETHYIAFDSDKKQLLCIRTDEHGNQVWVDAITEVFKEK